MAEEKKTNIFIENLKTLSEPENAQKYLLGTKKNGQPRAVYDIVKDVTGIKKKKKKNKNKKKKNKDKTSYSFYIDTKKGKKGKKHKKSKYWHI